MRADSPAVAPESRALRVGFDMSQTGATKAGCGYFAHAMQHALLELPDSAVRYVLYPSFGNFFFDASLEIAAKDLSPRATLGPGHRDRASASAFWEQPDLDSALEDVDIVHANNFWCPASLRRSRLVYTLYDLSFIAEPAWTTEANRVGCFEGVYRASIHADWIVAISRYSRDHFLRIFPYFPADRLSVIHPCSRFHGADDATTLGPWADRLDVPFWLNVGTIEPRKNQRRLLEAYRHALDAGAMENPLVIAGGTGWMMDDFRETIASLRLDDLVVLTGYVTDAQLWWLYRHCMCHVYPSLFEGFGLPVLEGMQAGAPTICSNSTSLPEVAGSAALLVDPLDVDALSDAMLRVARDLGLRASMRETSLRQAARFSWQASARQMESVYRTVAALPARSAQEASHS